MALGRRPTHTRRSPASTPACRPTLYITNGETDDYAYVDDRHARRTRRRARARARPAAGFVFPDDEDLVQAEFEKNLPFALDLGRQPGEPIPGHTPKLVHLGRQRPERRSTAATPSRSPTATRRRSRSWPARASATSSCTTRSTAAPSRPRRPREWHGGERYGAARVVYRTSARPGHRAPSPATPSRSGSGPARDRSSDSFTYRAEVESAARVLVLSAEDYTGISPVYADQTGPQLPVLPVPGRAGRQRHRRRRLRRRRPRAHGAGRARRPQPLRRRRLVHGRRHHHPRAGLVAPARRHGSPRTRCCRSATTSTRAATCCTPASTRATQYSNGYEYDPASNAPCDPASAADFCHLLLDDFRQYWLGAGIYNDDAGTSPDGSPFDVIGLDTPFAGLSWSFGHPSARNQDHTASFLTTSALMPPDRYPQFQSWPAANYDRPGGPFVPHTGSQYAYSQIEDQSYKRFVHTVDLTGQTSGSLSFWTSYRTEQDWDYLVVEAHTVGQDDWTTLPDQNGHTTTDRGRAAPPAGSTSIPSPPTTRRTTAPRQLHAAGRPAPGTRRPATAVAGRSGASTCRVRREAGRAVDQRTSATGDAGPRRVPRRRHALDGRVDVVRGRHAAAGPSARCRRAAPRSRHQLDRHATRRASRRARPSRRRRPSTWASGSREWPAPRRGPTILGNALDYLLSARLTRQQGGVAPRGAAPPYCRPCSTRSLSSGGRRTATTRRTSSR